MSKKSVEKSISKKILYSILIISSTITLIITIIQLSFDYHQEIDAVEESFRIIESGHSSGMATALWEINNKQIQNILTGLTTIPGIYRAEVKDGNGIFEVAGNLSPKKFITKDIKIFYPRNNVLTEIGTLKVYANLDQVYAKLQKRVYVLFFTQFLKALLVSTLIYWSIKKIVTEKVVYLNKFLENYSIKNSHKLSLDAFNIPLSFYSRPDEIDQLLESFNELDSQLKKSYKELESFNVELEDKVKSKTKEVLEQKELLVQANKLSTLGEVAGGIAHEINNPITIISSYVSVLKKLSDKNQLDKEKFSSILDIIDNTIIRISKIIKGMRNVSRDASNDQKALCTIRDIFDDVLPLYNEKLKNQNIKFDCNVDSVSTQRQILCNRVQISQVLMNLMTNSFDAIEDLNEKWMKIEFLEIEGGIKITFTDSGNGIPKEIQDKIFQPFFTTKEIGKGTGLGLSLSYRIIKDHGGNFYIDNENPNTSFVIELYS